MTNVMRAGIAAVMVAGLAAGGASAAPIDDWLTHKIPGAEPQVTYAGAPLTLKFAHPSPPASLVPPVWQAGFKWLEEATHGKLTLKEYAGGTLHGAKDGFKSARSGISDYSYCLFAHEARGFELSKVFELPFIMPANKLAAVRVVEELAPKYFKPEFERQGTYYGNIALMGASDIMSVKPIRKLEDMKGLKVIAQGFDPEAAKALGFVLVNIPYPEIYTAMQQGMVDAVLWVDPGFVPYKVFELAKFHTTLGLSAQHIDTCIAKKTFDGMTPDLKKAFYEFQTRIAYAIVKKVAVDFSAEAAETYKKNGVEMITLPADELARWKSALKPVVDDWAAKVEAEGKPAKQLLADIDALSRKYDKATPEEIFSLIVEKPVQGRIDF